MAKRKNSIDLDESALQVFAEYKDKLNHLLASLRQLIDNDDMPKAKDLLKPPDKSGKIRRPPNSNIIYTNQLNKVGLLEIIREYCENYEINKQNLVPISKKLSKILWKELSENYQKFFDKLASEVSVEHRILYPKYKYRPKRKSRVGTIKYYDPKTKKSSRESNQVDESNVEHTTQVDYEDDNELDEQMDSQDSENDDDYLPTFVENPPSSPLQSSQFYHNDE